MTASPPWELVTQWSGGTVLALASGGTGAGQRIYAATPAGLHVSEDGGESWAWLSLAPDTITDALACLSTDGPNATLLLGAGSGLHRSTDGGRSWRHVLTGSRVQTLATTSDPSVVATVLAGTETDGILRSEDDGLSWIGANAGLLDLTVLSVALSPSFGQDRTAFAGTTSGLFRSRNGARAWRLVELGPDAPAVQALAVSPAFEDDQLVLAGAEADGLFRSDDGGQTWDPVDGFPEPSVTSIAFGADGHTILVGTAAGVVRSTDGGVTWTLDGADLGPILCLTTVANGAAVAGTVDQGAVRLSADGAGWTPASARLAGRATVALDATMAFGDEPLLGVASLDAGVQISHDAGRNWKGAQAGLTALTATSLAFVRRTGGQPAALATFEDGLYWSDRIEAGWQRVDLSGLGLPADVRPTCLATVGDPTSAPTTILAAGVRCLLLSEDAGESWKLLPLPFAGAEIVTIAPSPAFGQDGTLYAGVRDYRTEGDGSRVLAGIDLWRTANRGRTWARWWSGPQATVMPIAVPAPGDLSSVVLVGRPGRVGRPMSQSAERRRGETRPLWQEARIGSPSETITCIALSPSVRTDRLVLAAATGTPYLSRDGGETFVAWDDGIQTPLVTGLRLLALPSGHLAAYALGLGGTVWRRPLT